MNIKRSQSYIIILYFALMTGCASQQVEQTAGTESKAVQPVAVQQDVKTTPSQNNTPVLVSQEVKPEHLKGETTVYFNSDSSVLSAKARRILASHLRYIKAHPGMSVTIEGYADDRGTDSYNMALGEKRAQSIKQVMLSENVSANAIKLISYGESRPAVPGHSKYARTQNRRARLVYQENREHVASN